MTLWIGRAAVRRPRPAASRPDPYAPPRPPLLRGAVAVVLVALGGCATTVAPIDETAPGYFTLTKRSGFLVAGPAELKYQAERQALDFCTARGKGLAVVQSTSAEADGREPASASVRFRCS